MKSIKRKLSEEVERENKLRDYSEIVKKENLKIFMKNDCSPFPGAEKWNEDEKQLFVVFNIWMLIS